MPQFELSPAALDSLREIARYTENRWGRQQRYRYAAALDNRFHDLAQFPLKGRNREDILPNLRSYPEGKHVIFYRITSSGIYIVNILHQQMDFPKHLTP